ncbi:hypothetical protein E4U24_002804 [Claviceps purpurea]|nr:hypothetical protein E4U24_002804 [Claviceps purpurea]
MKSEDYIKHDDNEPNTEELHRLDALGLSVKAAVVKPLPATSLFDRKHGQSLENPISRFDLQIPNLRPSRQILSHIVAVCPKSGWLCDPWRGLSKRQIGPVHSVDDPY